MITTTTTATSEWSSSKERSAQSYISFIHQLSAEHLQQQQLSYYYLFIRFKLLSFSFFFFFCSFSFDSFFFFSSSSDLILFQCRSAATAAIRLSKAILDLFFQSFFACFSLSANSQKTVIPKFWATELIHYIIIPWWLCCC